LRYRLGSFSVVQVNPRSREIIKITSEAKTRAGPLERLGFRTRAGVVIVGPFFSCCGMRTQAEDGHLTGHEHFRDNLLSLLRSKFVLVWMAYLRVQPAGVNSAFKRSV